MARATHARVLVRCGGTLPTGWVEAAVTNLCTQADYIIDGWTYPDTISTTSNIAIEIAVDVVLLLMRQTDMLKKSAGAVVGEGITYANVEVLTPDIKMRIKRQLRGTDMGIHLSDMIGGTNDSDT